MEIYSTYQQGITVEVRVACLPLRKGFLRRTCVDSVQIQYTSTYTKWIPTPFVTHPAKKKIETMRTLLSHSVGLGG